MDFASASLLLYLLFPVINERHLQYNIETKKKVDSNPDIIEKRQELKEILNSTEGFIPFYEVMEKNSGDMSEIYHKNSLGRISLFKYNEELFSVAENPSGRFSSISVNGDEFSRTRYDSDYRAVEKIVWKNADSVSDSKILLKKSWSYSENQMFSTEEDFKNNKYYKCVYNEKGMPLEIEEYEYVADPDSTEENPLPDIRFLSKKNLMTYDYENRLVSEEEILYRQTDSQIKNVSVESFRKKKLYSYTDKSESPDFKLYENGKLILVTEHTGDDTYTETIYFSDGFYIRAEFEDGIKIKESILREFQEEKN